MYSVILIKDMFGHFIQMVFHYILIISKYLLGFILTNIFEIVLSLLFIDFFCHTYVDCSRGVCVHICMLMAESILVVGKNKRLCLYMSLIHHVKFELLLSQLIIFVTKYYFMKHRLGTQKLTLQ